MRIRSLMPVVLVLALLGLLAVRSLLPRRPMARMELSFWYWHSQFRIGPDEARHLRKLGVERLFVRAGTISASNNGVELTMPQSWQASPGAPPLDLVFAMDSGVVRHFEDLPNRTIARCVAASFAQQRVTAQRAGLRVRGIQLDFDCATRLLPKYADLLRRVRRELPGGTVLSITSLPTWFTSSDLRELVQQVDFYCPQFYETSIGRTLAEARPVSDVRVLRNGLEAAGRLGRPFYAGIPAYGHAFMFDARGRLLGTFRGMSMPEAARHPAFRLSRSWPADVSGRRAARPAQWVGEDMVDFEAIRPGAGGKGLGYHILYSLPSPRMLSVNLRTVQERRPSCCMGTIIFRMPEPGEIMTLPAKCMETAWRGFDGRVRIRSGVKREAAPWAMIEGTYGDAASVLKVSLTNTGDAGAFPSRDAATLVLRFDAPGVEAETGGFDRVERLSASGMRAGPARVSALVFTKASFAAGETVTAGPIHVSGGARSMRGEWRVRNPGGFSDLKGKISVVHLGR